MTGRIMGKTSLGSGLLKNVRFKTSKDPATRVKSQFIRHSHPSALHQASGYHHSFKG